MRGCGQQKMTTGETLIYSGKTDESTGGVAIMMSPDAMKCLVDWKPINDRIIIARFKTKARHLTFLQVYAPTEQASPEEKDTFYQQLDKACRDVRMGDIKILSGDLNAKVGSDNKNWEKVMGRHGIGNMNENGELFADFCVNQDLVIGGTIFQHRRIHKYTWISPDQKTRNQIDHIAISRRWRGSLLDVRSSRGADIGSDHNLLIGAIRIKLAKAKKTSAPLERGCDIDQLKNEEKVIRYRNDLQAKLLGQNNIADPNSRWNFILSSYKEVASKILGFRLPGRKEWISDKTWALIDSRKKTKLLMNSRGSSSQLLEQYRSLNKEISNSARSDKRKWMANIARKAEEAARNCQTRETYRLIRKLSCNHSSSDHPLRDKQGNLLTMGEQKLERWSEYFEELLNKPAPESLQSPSTPRSILKVKDTAPTTREIREALEKLKNGKAPGNDNIYPEMLKASSDIIVEVLYPLLNEIWTSEEIPQKWKEGLIVKIPKKGDLSLCTNWRGITLLNTINKIVASIIQTRISNAIDPVLRKEQAGFRPERSCIDHISTIRIIIEQSVEFQSPLYLLFIDFERAFDTLDQSRMWIILENYGIPMKILKIMQELYKDVQCKVVHNGQCGRSINAGAGVKQGCILSPLLFIIVIDWVMNKVCNIPRGIQWTLTSRLEDLDFADDICLLSQTNKDMSVKLQRLIHYAGQVGLKINVNKTKLMRLDTQQSRNLIPLSIDNVNIDEVDEFCYLGSIITKDGGAESDVVSRIKKARQAFGMLTNLWKSSQVTRNLKLRIFKSNVLSTLLYGSETWKVTATITNKLQVFVNRCLRRILKIRWPETISNVDLHKRCKVDRIDVIVKKRKWSWIGHTLRRNNIASHVLDWNPQGVRKRGRPKQTWRRTIEDEISSTSSKKWSWKELKGLARNKVRFKQFCDALCASL